MTFKTTIILRRDGEPLGDPWLLPFAGRWRGDAERKAMRAAERMRLFRYATDVRIVCESPDGKTTGLCWLLARPADPLPPKDFV